MKHFAVGIIVGFGFSVTGSASLQFENGSFENPTAPSITILYAGDSIPGWRVTSGTIELIGPGCWEAGSGSQSVDMVGVITRGTIEQDITFPAPAEYYVSFQLSRNPRVTPPIQMGVSYRPPSSSQFLELGIFTYNEPTINGDMRWITTGTRSFVSEPGVTTFAFTSLTGGGSSDTDTWGGCALDNVTLGEGRSPYGDGILPVPEPSTLIAGALCLVPFGFQGIRFLRNRG